MPTFVHPALLWGLPVVAVPVLIHLINMMRHRRVEWAAMEFLLASQKKNRTRVFLKQLLLLLMRMAAVAMVVLVVAQPLLRSRLGSFFGGTKTHHVVLWDDSFSMSDRWADTSAFEEAKAVIRRIGAEAARQVQPQSFTLLRFSRTGQSAESTQPDLLEEPVDAGFVNRLGETLKPLEVSHTAGGPAAALEAVGQLLGSRNGENRVVYLVTDFRARQWDKPTELKNRLSRLNKLGAKLKLIQCVDTFRPNLAITELVPGAGTRAAGVPLFMEVSVKNFGPSPVKEVPVLLETNGQPLPAVKIREIPPGGVVRERFSVRFSTAGQHQITARLETDPVAADNVRYSVVDFPLELPVLLVDGGLEASDARYINVALSPGGPVPTGLKPRIEKPRYLSLHPLDPFRAIWLLNVGRLEQSAIEALEAYLAAGGGVAVFLGEQSQSKLINEQWVRNGEGFFPLPVAAPTELLLDRLQRAPDLQVSDHPIFRVFGGQRNSFISTVIVRRYVSVPKGWQPGPDSTTQVIARLRNSAPLVVERPFGEGRVVAFLTTAAPQWNNWARNNPSFVVAMLELQAFLSSNPGEEVSRPVGSPLRLELDPARYDAAVRFATPEPDAVPGSAATAVPGPGGLLLASLAGTDTSGIYEAQLGRKDGENEVRRWAFNVDPAEGDLKLVEGAKLAADLEGVRYQYEQAAMFHYTAEDLAGYSLSETLLYVLVGLLIAEQLLAWLASYHPPARRPLEARGGAP